MKVYFISGLAADSRVFKHICLPPGFQIEFLHWIPALKNDSLQSYAHKLAQKIKRSEPFVLVGLSMGGMIAVEIAKIYHPVTTILISSVPTNKQMPGYFKLAYYLKLHKLVPISLLKAASIRKRDFIPDSDSDKIILKKVIADSDPAFIRWSMNAILSWRNDEIPQSLWHIHGTKDEILPFRYTRPTHEIQGANHLMVMNKAVELNKFLEEILLES